MSSSPLTEQTPSYRSESSTRNSDRHGRRFGTKVTKYVRSVLHLPRPVMVTTRTTETIRRREAVAKDPTPGTEFIDQHEEEVTVRDDCVPQVISRPIPEGKTVTIDDP